MKSLFPMLSVEVKGDTVRIDQVNHSGGPRLVTIKMSVSEWNTLRDIVENQIAHPESQSVIGVY